MASRAGSEHSGWSFEPSSGGRAGRGREYVDPVETFPRLQTARSRLRMGSERSEARPTGPGCTEWYRPRPEAPVRSQPSASRVEGIEYRHMSGTLVVVESPSKAKTIEKYLGGEYTVRASYGHIRDLPKSELGVDVDHDFGVTYVVPDDAKKHVQELKRALKNADDLILATDYDREGEAIAFHVATLLGEDPASAKRVTFTEITRDVILESFQHPRAIDL